MALYVERQRAAGGKLQWVKRAKKLALVCDQYRTIASVRHLAAEIMSPLNTRQARPESTQTVADFISLVYLPHCKQTLRASTAYGYGHLFTLIKPHLGDIQLRSFGPVEAEQLLHDSHRRSRGPVADQEYERLSLGHVSVRREDRCHPV